eukprot:6338271-Alexandrium_andersonii.AAC.1
MVQRWPAWDQGGGGAEHHPQRPGHALQRGAREALPYPPSAADPSGRQGSGRTSAWQHNHRCGGPREVARGWRVRVHVRDR